MASLRRILKFSGTSFRTLAVSLSLLLADSAPLLARGSGSSGSHGSSGSFGGGAGGGGRSSSGGGGSWGNAGGSRGNTGSQSAPAPARSAPASSGGWGNGGRSSESQRGNSSGWGSSSRFSASGASTSPVSRTDAALARKTGESAQTFSSRSDAVRDFEAKYAKNYSSSYASEPASRPAHIPQTVLVDNRSYPVYYDAGHGAYGYWDNSGWRTYEVVRDAVMLGALMRNHDYSYSGYGGGYANYGQPYENVPVGYYRHSSGFGLLGGLICILFLFLCARLMMRIIF
jgi:hypothetical protein